MTTKPRDCQAYTVGDQVKCPACRLQWDISEERPACILSALTPRKRITKPNRRWINGWGYQVQRGW